MESNVSAFTAMCIGAGILIGMAVTTLILPLSTLMAWLLLMNGFVLMYIVLVIGKHYTKMLTIMQRLNEQYRPARDNHGQRNADSQ